MIITVKKKKTNPKENNCVSSRVKFLSQVLVKVKHLKNSMLVLADSCKALEELRNHTCARGTAPRLQRERERMLGMSRDHECGGAEGHGNKRPHLLAPPAPPIQRWPKQHAAMHGGSSHLPHPCAPAHPSVVNSPRNTGPAFVVPPRIRNTQLSSDCPREGQSPVLHN